MNIDREGAAMTDAELPINPVTGLHAVGLLDDGRPVWPVLGGADDDDDDGVGLDVAGGSSKSAADEEDDLDDEAGGADDDGADEDEWTPPSRKEWDKVQASIKQANKQAALHREEKQELQKDRVALRDLRRQQRSAERKAAATGDADDDAVVAARREAAEAAEAKYKPVAVRSAAMTALVKAEFRNPTDTRLNRMIRRLDMDELDVDFETGAVDGMSEQVEDLKMEFPELFGKDPEPEVPRQEKRRTPRINGANRETPAPAPKTTGEIHAQRALAGE